jgi:flagellar assembly factor FliW
MSQLHLDAVADGAATPVAPPPTAEPTAEPTAIVFRDGLPGFEACRRFALLVSDATAPLRRLDALDGPPASFLGIDPRLVMSEYRCALREPDRLRLEATSTTPLVWLALVAVETDGTVTVNLRAPVVINPDRMIGRQVLSDDAAHAVRHVLLQPEP